MKRFTKIPQNTFEALQMDAGVLLRNFDIEAAVSAANVPGFSDDDIVCATTGGISVSCVPTFSDLGADVDNCPNDMKELKHLDSWACNVSATCLGTSASLIKLTLGCADINASTAKIAPRVSLAQSDFSDLWWVGDKANGGFVAVKIKNALSTGGFTLTTSKNGKGQTTLQITGHVSIDNQDEMPMEFYSIDAPFELVTVQAEAGSTVLWGHNVSDLQTGLQVKGDTIVGTLKYVDSGALATDWGAGNFMALKFSGIDSKATSVKVGMRPSEGSGLAEIINDPDKNGTFKVTDKATQKFVVVITDGVNIEEQEYDLTGLVLETE